MISSLVVFLSAMAHFLGSNSQGTVQNTLHLAPEIGLGNRYPGEQLLNVVGLDVEVQTYEERPAFFLCYRDVYAPVAPPDSPRDCPLLDLQPLVGQPPVPGAGGDLL